MTGFDPRAYWEDRLGQDFSLRGVGFRRLGERFNRWSYRVREEVFLRVARESVPDLPQADVLDVGSGTGFYIDCWHRLGVRSVTSLDLTQAAVDGLRRRFPGVPVHLGDIGEGIPQVRPGSLQAVSAMDVLFHIVDDARFAAAVKNIHELLAPGGVFLWSDAFLHRGRVDLPHQVLRSLGEIERVVTGAGFQIVRRVPMLVLMNMPVDSRSRLLRGLWRGVFTVVSLAEPIGELAGRLLYPVESRLVRARRESPSIELMVCRRPD